MSATAVPSDLPPHDTKGSKDSPRIGQGGAGPLQGLRVVEFGVVAAGPYAGLLLADMGADVVKVEPPGGDHMRHWPPLVDLPDGEAFSLNFAAINRNKRSVVLDLKSAEGQNGARRLVEKADVVLENYRPGALARLGLGFADVVNINSSIIYCSLSGFGGTGPEAGRGAFDVVIQAASGMMDITGEADGPPVKCGVPVADFVAGSCAAFSILAARIGQAGNANAVHIDCSMLESLLAISALQTSEYWGTGQAPRRLGSAHPRNAPYQAFQAKDRTFVMAAGNESLWQATCEAIGRADLLDDPRFRNQAGRVTHMSELASLLNRTFVLNEAERWIEVLTAAGVPCSLVQNIPNALQMEQLAYRQFIRRIDLPGGGATEATVLPFHFNGSNALNLRRPPGLGEDTDAVMAEWLR